MLVQSLNIVAYRRFSRSPREPTLFHNPTSLALLTRLASVSYTAHVGLLHSPTRRQLSWRILRLIRGLTRSCSNSALCHRVLLRNSRTRPDPRSQCKTARHHTTYPRQTTRSRAQVTSTQLLSRHRRQARMNRTTMTIMTMPNSTGAFPDLLTLPGCASHAQAHVCLCRGHHSSPAMDAALG